MKAEPTPEEKVLRFIKKNRLLKKGEKLLVAVSGGPDSVCLLHILARLKKELGIRLHVAHLNHRLRGADANADAAYVAKLAKKLEIPATIEARDVSTYRTQRHLSLEEAAREVRYAFLAEVAQKVGAERVAVGHTADDNVEPILMHLIRGSGTRGLRGLLPISLIPSKNLTVIRPLLELRREETAAYCRHYRLAPRLDATNLSPEPFRNRIRHQLLPQLQNYNPQIVNALLRTARLAADDLAFIEAKAKRLRGKAAQREGDTIILNKKMLLNLHPALQRHLLRAAIEELLGDLKDIEGQHIEEIMDALEKPAGKCITLPGGLTFTIEYDRYLLGADTSGLSPFPTLESEASLKIPGRTKLPGWAITAAVISPTAMTEGTEPSAVKAERLASKNEYTDKGFSAFFGNERAGDGFTAFFDFEKTGDKLTVRRRRPGDRFQPLGLSAPKKLNQFMIDAKIPQSWRPRVPIVSAKEQIIWVAGWRIDERVKVTESTKKVLRLQFTRKEEP